MRGLGDFDAAAALRQPSFVRGALLVGKFRTHHQLIGMTDEDMRNALIVELTERTKQSDYQAYDDYTLAGMAAVLIYCATARFATAPR